MAEQHTLEIKDLYASVETKEGRKQILKGVNLTVHSGETHAIMGPNGSGKSTLAYTLAGHPKYEVDSGEALLDGVDILKQTPTCAPRKDSSSPCSIRSRFLACR